MGLHEWHCKGCGQTQKARVPNGVEVNTTSLCAACEEKRQAGEIDEEGHPLKIENNHKRGEEKAHRSHR